MNISIRAKNLQLVPELKIYAEEKISQAVERFLKEYKKPVDVSVELIRVTKHHQKGKIFRTEVQINLHGQRIVAEASGESIEESIDEVKDELEKEIRKQRGKSLDLNREKSRFLKALSHLSPLAWFKKKE